MGSLEMLTVRDTAQILRVSQKTVYKMLAEGSLYHVRVRGSIRIPMYALEQLLFDNKEELIHVHDISKST